MCRRSTTRPSRSLPDRLSPPRGATGAVPPPAPVVQQPANRPRRTPRLGRANPLLTWVLVGAGSALVLVLLLILLAK